MKTIKDSELFNDQLNDLEDEMELFLNNAEEILGYKPEGINDTINELLSKNTKNSKELVDDILDVQNDIALTEEFFTEESEDDDPFSTLYTEDNDF
jgi:ElaB/YqjD/DUF883 family membrane-anchored ribosome-binding protein